jgi:NAD(P)H-dependent flavin oxidoreductase YrpB (nitropropane dioxygenase family)
MNEATTTLTRAVRPIPVVAAGGVATGAGIVSALVLGAQVVSMGTRFVASTEAHAAQVYEQRIVLAGAGDTVLTELFDGGFPAAPHRVLRKRAFDDRQAAACPASGHRPGEGEVIGTMQSGGATVDIARYSACSPEAQLTADVEHMARYAGQSCELVHDIKPARQIVQDLVREAGEAMARLAADGAAQKGPSGASQLISLISSISMQSDVATWPA